VQSSSARPGAKCDQVGVHQTMRVRLESDDPQSCLSPVDSVIARFALTSTTTHPGLGELADDRYQYRLIRLRGTANYIAYMVMRQQNDLMRSDGAVDGCGGHD
jgi:hypothetical protein